MGEFLVTRAAVLVPTTAACSLSLTEPVLNG